jgi:hypothetical protein
MSDQTWDAPPILYKPDKKDLDNALTIAGRSIRLKLKAIYGDAESAEKAIRQQMEDTKTLEEWGTLSTGERFKFSEVPGHMKDPAILSMAAAYLVMQAEQAGEV